MEKLSKRVLIYLILIFVAIMLTSCGFLTDVFNVSTEVVVTYVNSGEGKSGEEVYEEGSIADLTDGKKEGYVFLGWYRTSDFRGNKVTNEQFKKYKAGTYTLYARYSYIYNVTYNTDGGSHSNPNSFIKEDNVQLSPAYKDGYLFQYWMDESGNAVEEFDLSSEKSIRLNAVFYKAYTASYILGCDDADNSGNVEIFSEKDVVELKDPVRAGYDFLGWQDEDTKEYVRSLKGSEGKNYVLVAVWTPHVYKLEWAVSGVDLSGYPESFVYGQDIDFLNVPIPEREGFLFMKWVDADTGEDIIIPLQAKDHTIKPEWESATKELNVTSWENTDIYIYLNTGSCPYTKIITDNSGAITLKLSDAYRQMCLEGKIGLRVSGELSFRGYTEGYAKATITASLYVDNALNKATEFVFNGGGRSFDYGLGIPPKPGSWQSATKTYYADFVLSDTSVVLGPKTNVTITGEDWNFTTKASYAWTSLSVEFYFIE